MVELASLDTIDFISDASTRKRHITSKVRSSQLSAKISNLPKETNQYKVVSLDPKYLLYNVDNARVRTHLQDVNNEYDPNKVDSLINSIYERMNDQDVQFLLHQFLFKESQVEGYDIFQELSTGEQGDYLEVDSAGVVIDGNRRLSAIREVLNSGSIEARDKLKSIQCTVVTDETGDNSRTRNKQIENDKNLTRNKQLKHHWIDQDSEIYRQYKEIYDPEVDNSSEVFEEIAKRYNLDGETPRQKANQAKLIIKRHQVTNKYLVFRQNNDDKSTKLEDLKKEDVLFDMNNLTKFIDDDPGFEKAVKFNFGFTFITGHKNGSLAGSSYKMLQKWDDYYTAFTDVCRTSDPEKLEDKLEKVLDKDKDEWTKFTEKVIEKKKKNDEKSDEEDRNTEVIRALRGMESEFENLLVEYNETIIQDDLDEAKTRLKAIEDWVEKVHSKIVNFNAD
tara:strand:+ start:1917 stop:3260 length:1344 start_codon:yes stop_codon:yes gene_type:complete